MATYKVIQDIEAEDKLLGPLTLKQFIYVGICVVCLYMSFLAITKHFPVMLVVFLPVAILTGFFGFPWKLNQPTEVWALAKFRFLFMTRKRIWDQTGMRELVTVTAPKEVAHNYSDNLSENEVRSRLKALADTIDSRGWSVKNINVNLASQPTVISTLPSDRLVGMSELPQEVPAVAVQAADDVFDEQSNPVAQHFDQMITAASSAHRQQIVNQLQAPAGSRPGDMSLPPVVAPAGAPPDDYWFMNQPQAQGNPQPGYVAFNSQVVAPGSDDSALPVLPAKPTDDEAAFIKQHRTAGAAAAKLPYAHMRNLQPPSRQAAAPAQTVTAPIDPAILNLASNNDLNVATLARQAQKDADKNEQDEVVISLR